MSTQELLKANHVKKLWLNPTSDAFKALQSVALDKHVLGDLKHLTKFSHTGILEIFHALYNKRIPKSQHFSYLGMVTRIQLAAMGFNSGIDLPQAKTKGGQGKYNLGYSKITKRWSSKPKKLKRTKHTTLRRQTEQLKLSKIRYNFHYLNY